MFKELTEVEWEEILKKFTTRECSAKDFCEKYDISKNEVYKRLRISQTSKEVRFHAIEVNEQEKNSEDLESKDTSCPEKYEGIKIEIGKAMIYIKKEDVETLKLVMRESIKSC